MDSTFETTPLALCEDPPPTQLGKYQSIAMLGSGGMSSVHLAVVHGPGGFHKLVVLKQLCAIPSQSHEYLPMFLDEARLAARLNHPNVVQTNEVGQSDDAYFIAMEYLDGQPLTNVLRRASTGAGLPLSFALSIVADACAGLHHAHELRDFDGSALNVVHRDVSPQNIFVTYDGQTKIVDFGVAKSEGRLVQTLAGVIKGKVAYMAPEQVRGEPVDRRADIFSLGVVLYESVAVRRLWRGREVDVARELSAGRVPSSPKDVRADLPDDVDRICRRALSPSAGERYPTALAMQRDLEQCLETMTPHPTPRALGELVSTLFADERQRIHAVIERQLRSLERIASGAASSPRLSIPALAPVGPPPVGSAPSGATRPAAVALFGRRFVAAALLGTALLLLLLGASVAVWHSPAGLGSQRIESGVNSRPATAMPAPAATSTFRVRSLASLEPADPAIAPFVQAPSPSPADLPRAAEPPVRGARRSPGVAPAGQRSAHPPPATIQLPPETEEPHDPLGDRK